MARELEVLEQIASAGKLNVMLGEKGVATPPTPTTLATTTTSPAPRDAVHGHAVALSWPIGGLTHWPPRSDFPYISRRRQTGK